MAKAVQDTSGYAPAREGAKGYVAAMIIAIDRFQQPGKGELAKVGEFDIPAFTVEKMLGRNLASEGLMKIEELLACRCRATGPEFAP